MHTPVVPGPWKSRDLHAPASPERFSPLNGFLDGALPGNTKIVFIPPLDYLPPVNYLLREGRRPSARKAVLGGGAHER